ncbi:response regulator [Ammoniphilus sp. CFH 90114]|uniref:response regulator n=1 Tax=Ammoniphilus sp. CFH 90114 TaxID=2493665 RepID=UPI00100E2CE2|nr:response regulator [Ammoniphilus sp. CFH 90114]RXT15347.1 response regulator [Ammoniphilus sp. CFH 90114]
MNLKIRLFMGFGFIIMLMILLLVSIVSMMNNQNRSMNKLVTDRYEKIQLANQIRFEVGQIGREINGVTFSAGEHFNNENIEAIQVSHRMVTDTLQKLSNIINLQQGKELLGNLNKDYQIYNTAVQQIIMLDLALQNEEAIEKQALLETHRQSLVSSIEALIDFQEGVMEETLVTSMQTYERAMNMVVIASVFVILFGIGMSIWVVHTVTNRLARVKNVMRSVVYGAEQLPRAEVVSKDEIGEIAIAFNEMAAALEEHERLERTYKESIQEQGWLKSKLAELSMLAQGLNDLKALGSQYISAMTPILGASYGVIYLRDRRGNQLTKLATYAGRGKQGESLGLTSIGIGEGLVDQSALENKTILLERVPEDYIQVSSGLGASAPASVVIAPIAFEGEVLGVLELASFEEFSPLHQALLEQATTHLGVTFDRIAKHMQVQELLKEAQTLNEELQSQSEELQLQQEELRTMNEELEAQYKNSEEKTNELEEIQIALEEKARQVVLSSKYKSEFLANMSHELRTPLNSLLILAHMLLENKENNLTVKQLEYAGTIYSSGNDLLQLINDILDLSKIESGKMDIHQGEVDLGEVLRFAERQFLPIARQKGIEYSIKMEQEVPNIIHTDEQRVCQILKNLLSNAFKFTEQGSVTLWVRSEAKSGRDNKHHSYICFSVVDTGIGIGPDKQELIFEAFRQADGTTSRKYGGTGLGLSICKELAQLLGGFIEIQSIEGKGSTFTFYLPIHEVESVIDLSPINKESAASFEQAIEEITGKEIHADTIKRSTGEPLEGRKIMVVDDDMRNIFALTSALEAEGLEVVFAENGREALHILADHPDIDLILMDIMMPEMDGYEAMQMIRHMPEFHSLPIIALTAKAMKHDRQKCIDAGASDYISKPVNLDQLFSLLRVWLYQ